jgi:hypothetical protein
MGAIKFPIRAERQVLAIITVNCQRSGDVIDAALRHYSCQGLVILPVTGQGESLNLIPPRTSRILLPIPACRRLRARPQSTNDACRNEPGMSCAALHCSSLPNAYGLRQRVAMAVRCICILESVNAH